MAVLTEESGEDAVLGEENHSDYYSIGGVLTQMLSYITSQSIKLANSIPVSERCILVAS